MRLNTNESPYAPPAAFVDALARRARATSTGTAIPTAARDRAARRARRVPRSAAPSGCSAANGSNEVLQTLLLTYGGTGRRALIFEPTYALHAHIARDHRRPRSSPGERGADFAIDPDAAAALDRARRGPSVVFVCSPNNPTGTVEPRETVERLLAAAAEIGALLVVDEAYGEFAPWSALELVDDDRPLVVVRTYSKVWSLAAVRLGFAVAPDVAGRRAREGAAAVHLSVPTQLAGTVALDFRREMEQRVASLVEERGRLFAALAELPGLDGRARRARTSCCSASTATRTTCGSACSTHGVLVRDFSSWPRLEGCLRVTVGTPAENDAFLAALDAALPEVVT